MANEENLRPVQSKSEARERGRNGGIKSGEARREKRKMCEILEILLSKNAGNSDMSCKEAILVRAIKQAIDGDPRAREFIRDTIGEKPTEKTQSEVMFTQALVEFIEVDNGQSERENSGTVQETAD